LTFDLQNLIWSSIGASEIFTVSFNKIAQDVHEISWDQADGPENKAFDNTVDQYRMSKLPWQTVDYSVISHPASSIDLVYGIKLVPYVVLRQLNPINISKTY